MRLWDDELEAARDTIRAETKAFVDGMPRGDSGQGSPVERARERRATESAWVVRSEKGRDRTIDGPAGPLRLREFRPKQPHAVMLHVHGGGWMTGEPELTDMLHEILADELALAVVSVDYRLSPEHPYPAGPDDCEAAACWLLEHAAKEFATDRLLIGGESAGAHLAAVTLLRLRDRHRAADRFVGANLVFGAYDLTQPPSAKGVGTDRDRDLLDAEDIRFMVEQFTPGMTADERRDPDVSPLYADLHGMPPALFTVGSADHLVDDTLFFAGRWLVAGNRAELLVYPDAPHGCMGVPTVMAHWWPRLQQFLRECIDASS